MLNYISTDTEATIKGKTITFTPYDKALFIASIAGLMSGTAATIICFPAFAVLGTSALATCAISCGCVTSFAAGALVLGCAVSTLCFAYTAHTSQDPDSVLEYRSFAATNLIASTSIASATLFCYTLVSASALSIMPATAIGIMTFALLYLAAKDVAFYYPDELHIFPTDLFNDTRVYNNSAFREKASTLFTALLRRDEANELAI